jgi:hypothetical protein
LRLSCFCRILKTEATSADNPFEACSGLGANVIRDSSRAFSLANGGFVSLCSLHPSGVS